MPADELPLRGLKVIDCSTIYAGPMAAMLLGDFGAEVVKIEHPETGDGLREYGDFDEEVNWSVYGRNKKSVPIDLHNDRGQDIFKELVADADVLIENFRPGTLERWGIGWETLSDVNPDLVMTRVTGFGQTGPKKDEPGFGTLAEAFGGLAYITGEPERKPLLTQNAPADKIAGLTATFATMFAVYWRDVNGGSGQYIDVSLFEPLFASMTEYVADYSVRGVVPERMGNRVPYAAPRNIYETKDGQWVALSGSTQATAKRILRAVGGDELAADERFGSNDRRIDNVEALDTVIQEWMADHTREEILRTFNENQAPIAPVYDMEDIIEDEHFDARDVLVEVEDEELGSVTMADSFPKFSETGGRIEHTGPRLGEHARDVLLEKTSLTEDELRDLARDDVVNLGTE